MLPGNSLVTHVDPGHKLDTVRQSQQMDSFKKKKKFRWVEEDFLWLADEKYFQFHSQSAMKLYACQEQSGQVKNWNLKFPIWVSYAYRQTSSASVSSALWQLLQASLRRERLKWCCVAKHSCIDRYSARIEFQWKHSHLHFHFNLLPLSAFWQLEKIKMMDEREKCARCYLLFHLCWHLQTVGVDNGRDLHKWIKPKTSRDQTLLVDNRSGYKCILMHGQ